MSGQLLDLLVPTAILPQISCRDQRELISRLGQPLHIGGYVRDGFIDGVLAREAQMPTGLPLMGEDHAALPHTDIIHVNRPAVALATLVDPLPFKNMGDPEEDVEVRLVFLLALKEPKSQIDMLQEIASILQDPVVVSNLVHAQTRGEIIQILSQPRG